LSRPKSLVGRTIAAHSSIRANPVFHLFAVRTLRSRHVPRRVTPSSRGGTGMRAEIAGRSRCGTAMRARFTSPGVGVHPASHSGLPSPPIRLRFSDGSRLAMGSAQPWLRSVAFLSAYSAAALQLRFRFRSACFSCRLDLQARRVCLTEQTPRASLQADAGI